MKCSGGRATHSTSRKSRTRIYSTFLFLALFAAILLAGSTVAVAQTFTTIYTFPGGSSGNSPGGLAQGKGGMLYGWTSQGGVPKSCGTQTCGTLFQLKPPAKSGGKWTKTTIHAFLGGADGGLPAGKLLVGGTGEVYGVTYEGGNLACLGGCGTVFQLVPPAKTGGTWAKKTIYSFSGTDGVGPDAGVVADSLGNLYGTTLSGGVDGLGTVYQLTPPVVTGGTWTETVLHSFTGMGIGLNFDGSHPDSELLANPSGGFYGTAVGTSSTVSGTVFTTSPQATVSLFGGFDGSGAASLISYNGIVYGITQDGGSGFQHGTIFQGTGTRTVLYVFDGTLGLYPSAILSDNNGVLYGAARAGGSGSHCQSGCGTIFKFRNGVPSLVYDFTGGTDGAGPSSLLRNGGVFYGTTTNGGNLAVCKGNGCGTVFKIQ